MSTPQLLRSGNFGYYAGCAVLGTHLYFAAEADSSGRELWRSDGTSAGTVLVKDIDPGSYGSYPYGFTAVGSSLFFIADGGSSGSELWSSDGTSAGTVLVKDINSGSSGSYPRQRTAVGSSLFFSAIDGSSGSELWTSDGTSAGTVLVKDINSGSSGSYPRQLTAVGNTLFFLANDGTGTELWKSDGTTAGTARVADIYPDISYADEFTVVGNSLFFIYDDGSSGYELWKSDGTIAGTTRVADINPGSAESYPTYLTAVGDTLFFRANDGSRGRELWKSDGTAAGTVLVKDISQGEDSGSYPGNLTAAGNTLFFTALEFGPDYKGEELWKSDGTAAGTVLVKDINPGSASSSISNITAVGSWIYFLADDGSSGKELWVSDGTADGTRQVADINPGTGDSEFDELVVAGTTLYLFRRDGEEGDLSELWALDASAAFASSRLSVRANTPAIQEGNSGSTVLNFTIERTGDTTGTSSVSWAVAGDGAYTADAQDFAGSILPSGRVTFTAGQTSKRVRVAIKGDTAAEAAEGLRLTLSNPTGAAILIDSATAEILNDDPIADLVVATASAPTTASSGASIALDWTVRNSGNRATTGSGFVNQVFLSRDTTIGDDDIALPGTSWSRSRLTAGSSASSGSQTVSLAGIAPGRWNLLFAADVNSTVLENLETNNLLVRSLFISPPVLGTLSALNGVVSSALDSSDVLNPEREGSYSEDYEITGLTPGTAVELNLEADFDTYLQLINADTQELIDRDDDGGEGLNSRLEFTPQAGVRYLARATSFDSNDTGPFTLRALSAAPPPSLAIAPRAADKPEGFRANTPFTFTVSRSGDTSAASSARWAVTGIGAAPADAADFARGVLPSGTVRFSAGQASRTITVNAQADLAQEMDERFQVTLSNPTGATITTASATGIIRNDDLIGTTANDTITGTTRPEFIDGLTGQDNLSGGAGPDVFGFRFGHSRISTPDRITDFRFGTDKLSLLTGQGQLRPAPLAFSRAANNSTATTLAALADAVFADADGALSGPQPLAANAAALVRSTNAAIAGTYLLINDANAGRSLTSDLLVNITGYSGTLPALGVRPVESVFA
jgi:ELWxxDGT repeat protein